MIIINGKEEGKKKERKKRYWHHCSCTKQEVTVHTKYICEY